MTKLSFGRLLLVGVVALVVAVPLASAYGTGGTAPDGQPVTDGQSGWTQAQPGTPAGPAHWNNSTVYWHDARWNATHWHDARWNDSTARWNGSGSYGAHPIHGGPGMYGAYPMHGGPGMYGAYPMHGGPGMYGAHPTHAGPGMYGAHPAYGPRRAYSAPGAHGQAWWTNATMPGPVDVPRNWWDGSARSDATDDRPVRPGPRRGPAGHRHGC
jgi:hypothetical protein